MKLFRTKSNASTPQSQPKPNNRLSRILTSNRSKADVSDSQSQHRGSSDAYALSRTQTASSGRHFSTSSSAYPPSLPPLDLNEDEGNFIDLPQGTPSSQVNANTSGIDEGDMTRKLMDIESSFVPEQSSPSKKESYFLSDTTRWPRTRTISPDRVEKTETYLKYGPGQIHHRTESYEASPLNPPKHISSARAPRGRPSEAGESDSGLQSTVPDQSFYTAATEAGSRASATPSSGSNLWRKPLPAQPADDSDVVNYGDSPRSVDSRRDNPSSPIEAATQRREARGGATSPLESRKIEGGDEESTPKQPRAAASQGLQEESPLSSNASVLRRRDLSSSQSVVQSSPGPPRLATRQESQYSAISSMLPDDDLDDESQGVDYALQSGGARSRDDFSSFLSGNDLPRPPSLGSIASSIHQRSPQKIVPLESRLSDGGFTGRFPENNRKILNPETPRAATQALADVTDTVLAQHVRDVHVPDTIAKEYRASHALAETVEMKQMLATPQVGPGKSNMTLKEQNTKIDKLSKENFDLKLKIHFLHQALQARSDEGVKELVSKNAQLQAELVKAKKDNQALRKRLRELEKQQQEQQEQQEQAEAASLAQSTQDGSGESHVHEDLAYYQDRVQILETENEKLAQVWQSVLEDETARRKKVEKNLENLRLELARIKESHAPELEGLQQEITRLKEYRSPLQRFRLRRTRPNLKKDNTSDSQLARKETSQSEQELGDSMSMSGTTVVEQLKQENADLRRDLSAQTSMLASRNRERERLQVEIEDLKLVHRRGELRSVAGDSVLDRSVSRNQHRPLSRASGYSQVSDVDRDRYEILHARLRDENSLLRMRNQDLQREVNALDDLRVEADADIEQLSEAVKEMEQHLQAKEQEISELISELNDREQEGEAFRRELQDISDSFNRITDDRDTTQTTIESLQQDLVNANRELDAMEQKLRDVNDAKDRLEVQQESSQSEIAFLREEQEVDKIKIGELQATLERTKYNQREEQSILKEVEELGVQASRAQEEARRLRKALASKEMETNNSAENIEQFENSLREALGSWDCDRAALFTDVSQLKRDLELSLDELDSMRQSLDEKEEEITEREGLLNASNLEIRRLTDLINNERQNYRRERAETAKSMPVDNSALLAEIEKARLQDQRRLTEVEKSFNEQLTGRNALLLALWDRLSAVCGNNWAQRHKISAAEGTAPTLESVTKDLSTFGKTISLAVKHIEHNVGHFRSRLHTTEEQIWRDLQALDIALQERAKRLQDLEELVQQQQQKRQYAERSKRTTTPDISANQPSTTSTDILRLKDDNKRLRRELKTLKHSSSQGSPVNNSSPSTSHQRNADAAANAGSPRSKRISMEQSIAQGTFYRANSDASSGKTGTHAPANTTAITQTSNTATATTNPTAAAAATAAANASSSVGAKSNSNSSSSPSTTSPTVLASTAALGMGRSAYVRASSFQRQPSSQASNSSRTARDTTAADPSPDSAVALNRPVTASTSTSGSVVHHDPATAAGTDVSWVLRLQEMQRRLEREREGRLLDRDGARVRLEEGRKEVETLRRELERVKARGVLRGGGVVAGVGGQEDVD